MSSEQRQSECICLQGVCVCAHACRRMCEHVCLCVGVSTTQLCQRERLPRNREKGGTRFRAAHLFT